MSDGLPLTGAALSARERGAVRKRLQTLRKQGDQRLRDLGELVFELAERGELTEAAVRTQAAGLAEIEDQLKELEGVLSGEPAPKPAEAKPKAPAKPAARRVPPVSAASGAAGPTAERDAGRPLPPGASGDGRGANGGTNGDTGERLELAVEQARGRTGQSATAEILALEGDLERERVQAAVALERVQRQLEEIEAREPSGPEVSATSDTSEVALTSTANRENAARRLRAQTERLRDEAAQQAHAKLQEREQLLLAERDEAVASLRDALATLERAEAGTSESEGRSEVETRLAAIEATLEDAVQRVEAAEASISTHAKEAAARLREREQELRDETEARALAAAWLRGQVKSIRRDAERASEERFAERERELTAELDEAASALRSAETRLAEAEEKLKALESHASRVIHPTAEPGELEGEPEPEEGLVDVNAATFEQLRELGMTVIQSTRVIAYRDRAGGFAGVDDLDAVPGFRKDFLAELKARLTA